MIAVGLLIKLLFLLHLAETISIGIAAGGLVKRTVIDVSSGHSCELCLRFFVSRCSFLGNHGKLIFYRDS